ncbi:MAG TPA: AarF/ABC1/UbiB kinase family protein, partial [Candidatus Hydrogenedentes bacterium]|nr:AarF/ABC1/UbiB kinase family protein [Candidatus Hydrogenedentota bacterium]
MPHTKLGRQTVNAVRFVEIVQVLVRHGFADMVRRAHLDQGWPGRLLQGIRMVPPPQGAGETFGSRLRKALTELGPTFIKLGQVLSTRPDLIGHTVAEELSGLLDEVTPVDFELMRPTIEGDLGRPLS